MLIISISFCAYLISVSIIGSFESLKNEFQNICLNMLMIENQYSDCELLKVRVYKNTHYEETVYGVE